MCCHSNISRPSHFSRNLPSPTSPLPHVPPTSLHPPFPGFSSWNKTKHYLHWEISERCSGRMRNEVIKWRWDWSRISKSLPLSPRFKLLRISRDQSRRSSLERATVNEVHVWSHKRGWLSAFLQIYNYFVVHSLPPYFHLSHQKQQIRW